MHARAWVAWGVLAVSMLVLAGLEGLSEPLLDRLSAAKDGWLGGDVALIATEELAGSVSADAVVLEAAGRVSSAAKPEGVAVGFKAVEGDYPLLPGWQISGGAEVKTALARGEALLTEELRGLLGVKIGGTVRIGSLNVPVGGWIDYEPDRYLGPPNRLPRVVVARKVWDAAAIGREAALPVFRYLFRGDAPSLERELVKKYPGAEVIRADAKRWDGAGAYERAIGFLRFGGAIILAFSILAASMTMALGYEERIAEVAAMKALGARPLRLMTMTLRQALWLWLAAAPVAALGGWLWASHVWELLRGWLALGGEAPVSWIAMAQCLAWMGVAVVLGVAGPLARTQFMRPGELLRRKALDLRMGEVVGMAAGAALLYLGKPWWAAGAVGVGFLLMRKPAGSRAQLGWVVAGACCVCYGIDLAGGFFFPVIEGRGAAAGSLLVAGITASEGEKLQEETGALVLQTSLGRFGGELLRLACVPGRGGWAVEERAARRYGWKIGQSLKVTMGGVEIRGNVAGFQNGGRLREMVSVVEMPCEEWGRLGRARVALVPEGAALLANRIAPRAAIWSESELREQSAVLNARARAIGREVQGFATALSLCVVFVFANWRFRERARMVAVWRVLGATRTVVYRKMLWRAVPELAAAGLAGLAAGTFWAHLTAWVVAGDQVRDFGDWGRALWALAMGVAAGLAGGAVELARVCRQRPGALLREPFERVL